MRSLSTFIPSHFSTLRAPRGAAFSLTEVVIALGIFAVSMVGVLALFPVASSTGRENSEETQAAIIAQTVLGDLRASSSFYTATNTAVTGWTNGWAVIGTDTFTARTNLNLRIPTNLAVAYNVKLRDRTDSGGGDPLIGPPIALKAFAMVTNYPQACTLPGAIYLSQIRVQPLTNAPGLTAVSIELSTPASVPLANRRTYGFGTVLVSP